jgi:hypothetical protein
MAPSPAGRRHRPARQLPRARARLVTLLALAALVVAACSTISTTPPPATPTDFPGLAGRLAKAGIAVDDYVSGDAGCTDGDLVPAAISFHASGLDQAVPVKLYFYVFRDRAAFERHRAQIGPCAQAYVTDPETFEEIEQSPYVLVGQGPWGQQFEARLRSVLEAAAGTGD